MSNEEIKVTDRRGQSEEKNQTAKTDPAPETKSGENTGTSSHAKTSSNQAPPIDFASFVLSLSSAALVQMGLIPDPVSKKKEKNLMLAQQQIGILEMLNEKTQGNRSSEEDKLMEQVLYELRMRFVEASK